MAKKVEYRDPTPNNFPKDYAVEDVDPRILTRTKSIYHKRIGADVREAVGESAEIAGVIAGKSVKASQEANDRSKDTQERFENQIAGTTNSDEVIDARGKYNILKNRLDAMDNSLYGISENDKVRDLFKPLLLTMRDNVKALPGKVNIGHITDTHYVVRSNYWGKFPLSSYGYNHIFNIAAVSDLMNVVIAGGDNSDENTARKELLYDQERDIATSLVTSCNAPAFLGIGNHDDNSVHSIDSKAPGNDFVMTDNDFAQVYYENTNLFGEVRNGKSNYFYYDIPDSNIRVVWIDLYENPTDLGSDGFLKYPRLNTSVIQQDQLQWLADKAFKTNRDVAVFTHCPLAGVFDNPTTNWHNHDVTMQLLNAFQTHAKVTLTGTSADFPIDLECDFTDCTGSIVGVFNGHKHRDDHVKLNGIDFVLTNASVGQEFDGTSHWNTNEEDSWSVINIDEPSKEVKIIKFGRGKGYEFSYGGD